MENPDGMRRLPTCRYDVIALGVGTCARVAAKVLPDGPVSLHIQTPGPCLRNIAFKKKKEDEEGEKKTQGLCSAVCIALFIQCK